MKDKKYDKLYNGIMFLEKSAVFLLCLVFLFPGVITSAEEKKYYQSGIYTYFIMNEQEKQISICGIASLESSIVIPSELDGYQVYALGYESHEEDSYRAASEIGGGIRENMEELVIPSSVRCIWPNTFSNSKKLRKVSLPEGITLCNGCFSGCENWKDIVLPPNTVCESGALPSGAIRTLQIGNHSVTAEAMFHGTIKTLIVSGGEQGIFNLASAWVSLTIKNLISPVGVEKLIFNYSDGKSRVCKLYVNDSETELEANRKHGYVTWGTVTFGELYTVEDANAISFARKNKIKYHVKRAAEVKKVARKKINNTYEYTWKKSGTKITSFQYNKSKKKWKKSVREIPTLYRVYGKITKAGKYRLITRTKAPKFKTKFKYIKVEPVATWESSKQP